MSPHVEPTQSAVQGESTEATLPSSRRIYGVLEAQGFSGWPIRFAYEPNHLSESESFGIAIVEAPEALETSSPFAFVYFDQNVTHAVRGADFLLLTIETMNHWATTSNFDNLTEDAVSILLAHAAANRMNLNDTPQVLPALLAVIDTRLSQ